MSLILVVEDEPAVAELVSAVLAARGHACALASDAVRGYRLLTARRFDLAVVDVVLPGGLDGIAFARLCTSRGVPVLLMSGADVDPPRELPFIRKPFRVPHLLDGVELALAPRAMVS